MEREQRAVDLHREVLAPAEGAADAAEVDAHLLLLEAEARRDLVAVDVQPLRRDVDVDAALAVGNREPGLRPEERLVLDPELVDALDCHLAGRVGVAVADHDRTKRRSGRGSSRKPWPAVGFSSWIGGCSVARSMSVTGSSGS